MHTSKMKLEFKRYGLENYRILTGILQLIGGTSLIFGFYFSNLLIAIAAIGLFLLMTAGFAVRLKIKDGPLQSAPAFIYALLCLYIAYETFNLINAS